MRDFIDIRAWLTCARSVPIAVVLGCSAAPHVEVQTFVGEPYARNDAALKRAYALEVLRTTFGALWTGRGDLNVDPIAAAHRLVHPPNNDRELHELTHSIRIGAYDEIAGPARRIAASPARVWKSIREALLKKRSSPKQDYSTLLQVIGGDVPDRYGHFTLAWKKAHGYRIKVSQDWFEDLLRLPQGRISSVLWPVYRDCVLQAAFLRAASTIASEHPELARDVVDALLDVAYLHGGTFRDEVGRAIQRIGDTAVPHLLAHSHGAIRPTVHNRRNMPAMRALYARHNLDRMERLQPDRAVAAVRDNPVQLTEVLGAYGLTKMGEAVDVLLDYADDDDLMVRATARTAFTFYVTGPAPKTVRRTVRLLGGATTTTRAFLTHRQRATTALEDRLAVVVPTRHVPPCEPEHDGTPGCVQTRPGQLTIAYFSWLDARRAASHATHISDALSATDPEVGLRALDAIVAQTSSIPHPEHVISFYHAQARRLWSENPQRAAGLLRKSGILAESLDLELADRLRRAAVVLEATDRSLTDAGRNMLLRSGGLSAPVDNKPGVDRSPSIAYSPHRTPQHATRLWGGSLLAVMGFSALGFCGAPLRRHVYRRAPRRSS